jgi:hypothetical protein
MRYFFIFVSAIALYACSSPPKPPSYEGAPRVKINAPFIVPDIEITSTAIVPS